MPLPDDPRLVASLSALRVARRELATVIATIDASGVQGDELWPHKTELARAVGSLYRAETGDLAVVRSAIDDAMRHLRTALAGLESADASMRAADHAMAGVARTLAVLWPARRELDRDPSSSSLVAAPVPLERRRKRALLEIVPEGDEVERRAAERIELQVDIGFQSDTNFFTGYAEDLSDGGLFIATYDIKAIGTPLTVSFVLPGGRHVVAPCRVTWVREPFDQSSDTKPGMGVAFERLDEADRAAILRFCTQRPPLFFDG